MADSTDPFASFNFDAISKAANREDKVLTQPAVAGAVKEEKRLFQREIRKKVLGIVKTVLDIALYLFCIILVIRAYHLINPYPHPYTWLDEAHLAPIDNLLKSSVLVAAGGVFRDVIVSSLPAKKKKKKAS